MSALIRSSVLDGYSDLVQSLGGDPQAMLRRHGIEPLDNGELAPFVPYASVLRLIEASAGALQCDDFGLRLSRQLMELQELGVDPYAGYARPNEQLLTQTREDTAGNRYLYVYNYEDGSYRDKSLRPEIRNSPNPGLNIKTDIEMDGHFVPHVIDAWTGKSTELANYRWQDGKTVVFRQIVGILARRVVCRVTRGQHVQAGDRFGIMKFGSRMDVFVPASSLVKVAVGDQVRGGETVLATL